MSKAITLLCALAAIGTSAAAQASASTLATNAAMRGALLPELKHMALAAVAYDSDGPSLDDMTREQLQAELKRLEGQPSGSLVSPIVIASVGGASLVTGLIVLFASVATWDGVEFAAGAAVGVVLGLGFIIAGAIMLPIGLVKLFRAIRENNANKERIGQIRSRLASPFDQAPPPPPALEDMPPPPPPSSWVAPKPTLLVAEF